MGGNTLQGRAHHGAKRGSDFGDPRLTNVELAPVPQEQRRLRLVDLAILWAGVAVSPATYSFACGALPWRGALATLALAALVIALVGVGLSFTAARYGIGFVALTRAAFGPRGGGVVVALRGVVGVGLLAIWSREVGGAVARLLTGGSPGADRWTQQGITGLVAAALLLVAWYVSRGGLSRIRRATGAGLALAVLLGFGLVVWAGIASRGFGPWLVRVAPFAPRDVVDGVARTLLTSLAGLVACADWERFRVVAGQGRADWQVRLVRLAPFALLPIMIGLAFLGALLASAADAVQGSAAAAPIPDAAAFGGTVAGALAAVLAGVLFLVVAPLVGFYSTALAVCGLAPRRAGYLAGLKLTLAAALATVLLASLVPRAATVAGGLAAALAAVVAVLLVDELFVRRGRVVLEELFLFGRHYGPWLGVSGGGLLALVAGWTLHPELLTRLLPRLQASFAPGGWLPTAAGWGVPTVGILGGATFALVVYLAVAPLERWLVRRAARGAVVASDPARPAVVDDTPTATTTNPMFVESKKR